MGFKYFLRGLGVGIVFSAIICMTAYRGNANVKLSDDEIIRRAKELGYVEKENNVDKQIEKLKDENLAEHKDSANDQKKDKVTSEITENTVEKTSENKQTENNSTEATTTEKKIEEVAKESTQEVTTELKTEEVTTKEDKKNSEKKEEKITFTIEPGSTSFPVCQKLEGLGLIDNAAEFDTYLVDNGYANRISVGEHSLKKGMSYHDIAELISDPLE